VSQQLERSTKFERLRDRLTQGALCAHPEMADGAFLGLLIAMDVFVLAEGLLGREEQATVCALVAFICEDVSSGNY